MADERQGSEKLVRGTVERGRTIRVPNDRDMQIVGTNPETGKPIRAPKIVEYGPGEEVNLPESEIKSLRALGFIVDPARVLKTVPAEGSHLSELAPAS
ncbi:hypothetical protein [Bradyrhizobium japonicum]|uniref:hypothetical protein n=1 Tax=Bradyrhizobium japonicum TaxID=375 RepID=UPI0003F7BFF7|nr:hypothetical protein [Bradyrhizobium japonicum]